jgi:hypothetical protein
MNKLTHRLRAMAQCALALLAFGLALPASAGYWDGVSRAVPVTPLGNKVAISCHNCYGTTTTATATEVSKAINRGFDLVEFDLVSNGGTVYVNHNDDGGVYGTFDATLNNASLLASNLMLFIEIKEPYATAASSDTFMTSVLRTIRDKGYATAGRPVFLRAFMDGRHNHLVRAKALLAATEFNGIRANIKFHTLIESNIRANIRTTQSLGFQGVELNYTMASLYGAAMQAKMLGLGVGVYTGPASLGELYVSAMREDMDFITTQYDRGATALPTSVRALAQEATSLLYMNTAMQTAYPLTYKRTAASPNSSVSASATTPALEVLGVASDEDRVGGSMVFTGSQSIPTYDADNAASDGYLVSAVVNFDDLSSGNTQTLIAKSDSGGFALELTATQLRFGVYVNGAYTYATTPISGLNGTDSFFIVGCYDGSGAVRLWVNNAEKTASASVTGGVGQNNSAVVIGADPQGTGTPRFNFKGKIQQVMVQKWRNH